MLVASLMLASTTAMAKGKPSKSPARSSKDAREREARKACLEGDYVRGVAILSELFLDTVQAAYIFNQGRCYEQNDRYDEAINRFREYLRISKEDRAVAEKHIAECEALARKKSSTREVAPPPQPIVAPAILPSPAPPPVQAPPAAPPPALQPAPAAVLPQNALLPTLVDRGSGLRIAGMVVAGVGVAGLIAGVALNLKANSVADSITPPNTYQRSTESTRKNYEALSWLGYGVGVAGLATGAVVFGLGWSRKSSGHGLAVMPALGPGLAGVTLGRTF